VNRRVAVDIALQRAGDRARGAVMASHLQKGSPPPQLRA
jgi:hypothetical protein